MQQKSLAESARIVRWLAIILLAVLVAAFIVSRIGLDLGSAISVVRRSHLTGQSVAGLVPELSVLFFAIALVQLIRLLGRLGSGELFAPGVTGAFRAFAFWLMLSAIVAILAPPLASLMTQSGSPRRIAILIDLRDIMFLIAGLVLFLVARMLDEAARLDAELREIV